MSEANPLLEQHQFPPFDRIRPEHVLPAIEQLIDEWREALAEVEPEQLLATEEELSDRLDGAFAPISHLHSVADSPEWREVYGEGVVRLTEFHTELNQDERRYGAYRELKESDSYDKLDAAQQRAVDNTLRDFRLTGIELDGMLRQRFGEIVRHLTEQGTAFQQNLQDATDAWHRDFEDASALAGLPEMQLEQARAAAEAAGVEGYRISLEFPSYQAVMTHADDRDLRAEVYRAYLTRASDQGPHAHEWDNGPVLRDILALRQEKAQLLGFDDYRGYSLATKMADSPDQVLEFLEGLAKRARPKAEQELAELQAFTGAQGGPTSLEPWDVAYFSEKLRKERYAISDEEIRPYFPFPSVLEGLFEVASCLFGVRFAIREEGVPTWHEDVVFVDVLDSDGELIAGVYLDMYARTGKRGGAWMADCRSLRRLDEGWQLPVAFLTCNFPRPSGERPALLSHDEVTTLFHEFGHGLHHMLTRIPHPSVGGISGVEWDAVELPSQFLENWCWEREALDRFARHVDTGEPLPPDLFERMRKARLFHSGLFLVRQLEFALTDFRLHGEYDPAEPECVRRIQQEVRDRVAVIQPPEWTRFLNGFGHLFAGGYAAGYYSYLWADQLAADAFSRFAEEGVFNGDTGAAFRREILEVGGSRDAMDSFRAFRGREPDLRPMLRHYGIEDAA